METTFNEYSLQGNRGAVGKQGLSGEPGAQVRQDSDFYLTRRIGHFWLGRVLLSINRCIILLQGQIGPRGENGEFGLTGEMVSKKKVFLAPLWLFSLLYKKRERLPFVWKTRKFRGEFKWNGSSRWKFSGKKVIPFEVLPFSRSYRNDRNFLYHLFGLPVPGFMSRESEKFTGIL